MTGRADHLGLGAVVRVRQRGEEDLAATQHADQEVVEIVRNSAREHAQAFEALTPLHLELELPALLFQSPRLAKIADGGDAYRLAVHGGEHRDDHHRYEFAA